MVKYRIVSGNGVAGLSVEQGGVHSAQIGFGSIIAAILSDIKRYPDDSARRILLKSVEIEPDTKNIIYTQVVGTWDPTRFTGWAQALRRLIRR